MKIIFAFRRAQPNLFSLEELFDTLSSHIPFEKEKIIAPYYSNGLKNILKNILFFNQFNRKGNIIHITGDIHYVLLGIWKAKTILTIHDCVSLERVSKYSLKYWLIKFLWYDIPVRIANQITVISEKTKEDLLKYTNVNPKKITVIPNFVKDIFVPLNKEFNRDCPNILLIGFAPNKNIERSIKALKNLNVCIFLIGKYENDILEMLEKGNYNYHIFNNLKHNEVVEKYQKADILLFPSLYEGFGMPIIEAQAVGIPIVISNISPLNVVSGKGACLVNPYDIENIREGILNIITNTEFREKIIEEGFKNVEKYRFPITLKQYINIYSSCAE